MFKLSTRYYASSKSYEWATPPELFKKLDDEFHFTLDPCASKENAKCSKFYTKEDDGLTKDWGGERAFVNPPYGSFVGLWIKKAFEEAQKPNTLVVCLIPARTDTRWFQNYCMNSREIRLIKGRIKFLYQGKKINSSTFPSAIVIFGDYYRGRTRVMVKSYEF